MRCVRPRLGCSARGWPECAERVERVRELGGPRPFGGESQGGLAGAVHDPARNREESGAHGARHDELVINTNLAEHRGPTDQVVREDRALQPRRVRVEVPRRDVLEPGAFFQVADRELDDRVLSMKSVNVDRGG